MRLRRVFAPMVAALLAVGLMTTSCSLLDRDGFANIKADCEKKVVDYTHRNDTQYALPELNDTIDSLKQDHNVQAFVRVTNFSNGESPATYQKKFTESCGFGERTILVVSNDRSTSADMFFGTKFQPLQPFLGQLVADWKVDVEKWMGCGPDTDALLSVINQDLLADQAGFPLPQLPISVVPATPAQP